MEKYIGLDLGTTTVGIAVSDSLGIVHGRENCCFEPGNFKKAREHVIELIRKEQIFNVVCGWPLQIDGQEGKRCASTKRFMTDILKEIPDLRVFYQDELYSTIAAKERMDEMSMNYKKEKNLIDMFSAIIILESFLEEK